MIHEHCTLSSSKQCLKDMCVWRKHWLRSCPQTFLLVRLLGDLRTETPSQPSTASSGSSNPERFKRGNSDSNLEFPSHKLSLLNILVNDSGL